MSAAKKPAAGRGAKGTSKKTRTAGSKKSSSTRSVAKKTAAKKAAKRSTGTKKSAAKKSTKKAAKRSTGTKKTAARKTAAKKTAAKKTAAKKTAARKKTSATKKTSAKKNTRSSATKSTSPAPVMTRAPAPKRRVRPAKLDKKILAAIRERLESDRVDLESQLEEIERDSITESEDTGLHEDFADAGTSTFERERDLSIRNNVMDLLDQVKRAVARIDEGGYGTCENCGRPIDAARLKAFPRVLMCLDCKRRDERTR